MLGDIQNAPVHCPVDRAITFSQFTREFGEVQGNPHDETSLTSAPTEFLIPTGGGILCARPRSEARSSICPIVITSEMTAAQICGYCQVHFQTREDAEQLAKCTLCSIGPITVRACSIRGEADKISRAICILHLASSSTEHATKPTSERRQNRSRHENSKDADAKDSTVTVVVMIVLLWRGAIDMIVVISI